MNIEAINAVTREKARIREAVIKLSEEKGIVAGFTEEQEVTWIPRGEVLAIISENVVDARRIPVKSVCKETTVLKAVYATTPETEKNLKEAMKNTPLDMMRHSSIFIPTAMPHQRTHRLTYNLWLIWSNEHNAWWAPNERGYTTSREKAGRYEYYKALEIVRAANIRNGDRPMETMVKCDEADPVVDGPTEKIPESEWNLDRFKENPVILQNHDPEDYLFKDTPFEHANGGTKHDKHE